MNAAARPLSPPVVSSSATAAMRAVVQTAYGSLDVLQVGTTARPTPGAGEVLVQVRAAGLDRGTWHLMTGRPYLMRLMGFGFSAPKQPVAGRDLAGVVVELGPDTTGFAIGDEVFGIGEGSFAEYARVRVDKLAHKPARLDFAEAAVLGISGSTALQALRDAGQVEAGQRVLVLGASGGVGTYAVQLAKHFGAHVTGVASTAKLELVRSLGADDVIDYSTRDFADGSARWDLILDVGGNTPLARLRRALAPRGRLVFVGGELGGDWTAGFERQLLAFLLAPFVRQRFAMLNNRENAADLVRLAELADAGAITPVIDRRVPLHAVPDAMRELEAGRVRGKIAITVA